MTYPIIRKTNYSGVHYGASVERYQRRFSRKNEAKLQRKLSKFQNRLMKLQSKTSRFGANIRARRIARLEKKIQAIQMVLGMQPFDASFSAEAMTIAEDTVNPSPLPVIIAVTFALGAGAFIFTRMRK